MIKISMDLKNSGRYVVKQLYVYNCYIDRLNEVSNLNTETGKVRNISCMFT